jgi:hypothetical protein
MCDRQRDAGATTTIREAVSVFHDPDALQDAIDEVLSSGFDRAELSLLAGEHAVEEKLGHRYRKVAELEDDPRVPRTAYVSIESIGDAEGGLIGGLMYVGAVVAGSAVVASGGTLAGAFLAAAMAAAQAASSVRLWQSSSIITTPITCSGSWTKAACCFG